MFKLLRVLKQSRGFFIVSYISILIFSFFLYVNNFHQLISYEIILKSILTSIILWYLLYLSSYRQWLYYIMVLLLAVMTTIKIYYSFILGVHIEPSVFEGMFDTNLDEVKRLGSSKPIFIFLAILSFLAIVIEFNWLKSFSFKKRVKIHIFKIVAVVALLIAYGIYKHNLHMTSLENFVQQTYPVSFVNSFYKATSSRYRLYKMNKNKIDIVKKYGFSRSADDNFTVVFVRGESLRARSFPVSDEDIPLSYRLDDINNTVFYNNVFSYANYTQAAVPWMLTRSVDDKLQNEKSLISVVKYVGFDTTWIGCDHSNLANFATPIVNFSLEADRSLFLGKLHEWLNENNSIYSLPQQKLELPQQKYFNEVVGSNAFDGLQFAYLLSKINKQNKKKLFFWVEMNGSHVPWTTLVPEKFQLFTPFCTKVLDEINECSQIEATNAYRNTIVYSQYLLKKLILSLKDKNAIVFFVSDHGESTGENGYYGHGFMLPEDKRKIRDQINPAFMVWMSDKFKVAHTKEFEALKRNASKTMKHDVIFHSVLDVLGIQSNIIEKKKSVFSDHFIGRLKSFVHIIKQENINIDNFKNNKIIFHLSQKEPAAGFIGKLRLELDGDLKKIKVYITDLYEKKEFPNRIKYHILYHGKVLCEQDLADNKKDLVEIPIVADDRNISIEVIAQHNIEKGWAWGDAAKIEVEFIIDD